MPQKIALIGLGNILLGDEGFGVHFIRHLETHFLFPKEVSLIDGGCAGFKLLNLMRNQNVVYLFDIFLADEKPGTIKIFDWETIENLEDSQFASVHQLGVKDALRMAHFHGHVPQHFKAFGVVPEKLKAGVGLSSSLQHAITSLTHLTFQELAQWQIYPHPRKDLNPDSSLSGRILKKTP